MYHLGNKMLVAAESFFAVFGIVFFVAGFLCCFVPRHFKFGVVTMLIGDLAFLLAIAFPKKMLHLLALFGLSPENFGSRLFFAGGTAGAAGLLLWYLLFRFIRRFRNRKRAAISRNQEAEHQEAQPASPAGSAERRLAYAAISKTGSKQFLRVRSRRRIIDLRSSEKASTKLVDGEVKEKHDEAQDNAEAL